MPDLSSRLRSNRLRTASHLALFACAFLVVGWSIFWFLAHRSALHELNSTLALEAAQGRDWSCGALTSGGYPFAIEIDCDSPAFKTSSAGFATTVKLRRALIRAPLYTPKLVTIDLTGPAETIFDTIPMRSTIDWRTLQLSSRGLPDRLDRLSIVGEGAVVEMQLTSAPASRMRVLAFQTHLRRASGAVGSPYNIAASFAGVESDALDLATGSKIPAVIAAIGSVTQADKAIAGSTVERLELWRAAGGRVTVNLLSLQKGVLAVQAEGAFGLDQARRLDGKLDVRLQNAAAPAMNLAGQLGLVAPNSLAAGLLGAFLNAAGANGETRIQVAFENGALSVGPLKGVVALPPLY